MAGQEQVMLQLSSLLQKLNAGVDQAGPLLVKQIVVERIETGIGFLFGLLLLIVAVVSYRFVSRKIGTDKGENYYRNKYNWDDGMGWCVLSGVSATVGIIVTAITLCSIIQLTFNPMWYVISELAGK